MLIGVDASRITRLRTGTENFSLHLLAEMLRQDTRNRYRFYTSAPLPRGLLPRQPDETRLIRLPRLWTHVGLSAQMLLQQPDVLFVPSHVLPLVNARRSVVVVYDVGHRYVPDAHGRLERLYLEWSIRRHVRLATRLLTISHAAKQDLVRLFGADPARVSVAYPAVDEMFSPPSSAEVAAVRARYGLPQRYVLHVGTVKPRKNLARLVDAFAAAQLSSDTCLVLAGAAGPAAAALETRVAALGLRQRVRLLSYVPLEDLPALYGGAACAVVVSLFEGFGMPALEALACGAPVLVSNRSALPEVVGDAGVLVDPMDVPAIARGLDQLVGDDALADRLRQQGPRRAASFMWPAAGRIALDAVNAAAL